MCAYLLAPVVMEPAAVESNVHHLAVLSPRAERAGQAIAFDRVRYVVDAEGRRWIHSWTGERFEAVRGGPAESAALSLRGRFLDRTTIAIDEYHQHYRYA